MSYHCIAAIDVALNTRLKHKKCVKYELDVHVFAHVDTANMQRKMKHG